MRSVYICLTFILCSTTVFAQALSGTSVNRVLLNEKEQLNNIYMNSCIACFLCFISCIACSNGYIANSNSLDANAAFISWNKATFLSLRNRIRSAPNNSQQEIYKNRLEALGKFLGVEDENKINNQSIRYKFLRELPSDISNKKKFYIIEATSSGEVVEIRNYLISIKTNNSTEAEVYNFSNDKWVRNNSPERMDIPFETNLKAYIAKFGQGFNQDDVIITEFVDGVAKTSLYYLSATLSDVGSIKRILSLR